MTNKQRLQELIKEGEDLKERLLPIWAEYRRFVLDVGRYNRQTWPVIRIDMAGLETPDFDFILDVLGEHSRQLDRSEDYLRNIGANAN